MNNENDFANAKKLTKAAEHLDWLKNTAPANAALRAEIAQSVDFLNNMAQELAGDRAGEIFKEGDPTPEEVFLFQQLLLAADMGGSNQIAEDVCLNITTSH